MGAYFLPPPLLLPLSLTTGMSLHKAITTAETIYPLPSLPGKFLQLKNFSEWKLPTHMRACVCVCSSNKQL